VGTVAKAAKLNSRLCFEVFIHKVDGLADDNKLERSSSIQQRVANELADARLEPIPLSYYLTSIYDHSIFEAFSKVVQKLVPQLPTLENLLNVLIASCRMEKSFLIDLVSKIYIATDSSPVDMQTYGRLSDQMLRAELWR
jgi:Ras-related GTP-binding protein C/D